MKVYKRLINCIFPILVVAVIFLIWWIAALAIDASLVLPSPSESLRAFFDYFAEASFWRAIGNTMWRSFYSFIVSFALAIVSALLAYRYRYAKKLINPFIAFIRSVPTMSVILILIIWLNPRIAPAVVAIIVIFPTLYSSFAAAVESIDPRLIAMSEVYRVSKKERICKLYLPNMAPGLFEGSASGFSLNIKLVIAAEALAHTTASIGSMMNFSQALLETQELFALTIAAVLLSVLCEWAIRLAAKAVIRWK